jgi:hypothetical protein
MLYRLGLMSSSTLIVKATAVYTPTVTASTELAPIVKGFVFSFTTTIETTEQSRLMPRYSHTVKAVITVEFHSHGQGYCMQFRFMQLRLVP